jgi:hypothetical protein
MPSDGKQYPLYYIIDNILKPYDMINTDDEAKIREWANAKATPT